jgi:hypothetical protein
MYGIGKELGLESVLRIRCDRKNMLSDKNHVLKYHEKSCEISIENRVRSHSKIWQ